MKASEEMVTLVGAGPGNPDLLTVGGRKALEEAQVVLHDRLAGEEILRLANPGAELVDVGKSSGRHRVPQEEINRLLLDYAKQGKRVVRLKGGDPYLFGRGGEELELLAKHGVPFRVLPGVTSAIAAPGWAGIPVTHREHASSVHIITGHPKAGGVPAIPYRALTEAGGTLVFLMGVSALADICRGLADAGMAGSTPCALVEKGSTADQRKLRATLETLPQQAEAAGIAPPAVLVVGTVCALPEELDWYSALPLRGKRAVLPVIRGSRGKLGNLLREAGCRVEELPCVEQIPREQPPSFWEGLGRYGWVVFTSAYGASLFFDGFLACTGDIRKLNGLRFAAVGRETAGEIRRRGLPVDCVPEVFDGKHLGEALARQTEPGEKALLFRAEEGAPDLPNLLSERGIPFDEAVAYRTVIWEEGPVPAGDWDFAVFTSGSLAEGFARRMGRDALAGREAVCIGATTAQKAGELGIKPLVSREATLDSLMERILEQYGRRD